MTKQYLRSFFTFLEKELRRAIEAEIVFENGKLYLIINGRNIDITHRLTSLKYNVTKIPLLLFILTCSIYYRRNDIMRYISGIKSSRISCSIKYYLLEDKYEVDGRKVSFDELINNYIIRSNVDKNLDEILRREFKKEDIIFEGVKYGILYYISKDRGAPFLFVGSSTYFGGWTGKFIFRKNWEYDSFPIGLKFNENNIESTPLVIYPVAHPHVPFTAPLVEFCADAFRVEKIKQLCNLFSSIKVGDLSEEIKNIENSNLMRKAKCMLKIAMELADIPRDPERDLGYPGRRDMEVLARDSGAFVKPRRVMI